MHNGSFRTHVCVEYIHLGGWQIKDYAHLLEWACPRVCTTSAEFFDGSGDDIGIREFNSHRDSEEFYQKSRYFKHEVIVLKCFEHEVQDEKGAKSLCCGLILTSRFALRNVLYAHNGQQHDGIIGVTDGTYKMHHGKQNIERSIYTVSY